MFMYMCFIDFCVCCSRADATAADTRGYMGSRYELHWSVRGARDLNKSLNTLKSLESIGNQ